MFIVLSPAKSLDSQTTVPYAEKSLPVFTEETKTLIQLARQLSVNDIAALMSISGDLARLNVARFNNWQDVAHYGRQAIFTFNGDVYEGLDAFSLKAVQLEYLQKHLGILSGLYGMLKPFDLMQEYRLEMGTRLANPLGTNLYAFWGDKVTKLLNQYLQKQNSKYVLNLASDEYFKVLKPAKLEAQLVQPVFQDWKNGRYKVISFYAKRARGLMARFCAENAIIDPQKLKRFTSEGYAFVESESTADTWVFRRRISD